MPLHVGSVESNAEEKAQCRYRTVHARRLYPVLPLMQLKTPQIVGACAIGRAAKKRRKTLDLADIVVARLVAEIAHRHRVQHPLAQRADGLIVHRSAPL